MKHTLKLMKMALCYNLDAHRSNPANLFAGAFGMLINNVLFLCGMWGMLFAGKASNAKLVPYYIALNSIIMASYGFVHFFFGGLRAIGDYITEGTLEPMLATPRDPILLAAISKSSTFALGDLIMGMMGIIAMAFHLHPDFTLLLSLRTFIAAVISAIAFSALAIAAGSISFFIPRGTQVGNLLYEITISLSSYPTGKMFSGTGRIFLLLTPAAATAILPIEAVEKADFISFLLATVVALLFFAGSVVFFRTGIRRYRSVSSLSV